MEGFWEVLHRNAEEFHNKLSLALEKLKTGLEVASASTRYAGETARCQRGVQGDRVIQASEPPVSTLFPQQQLKVKGQRPQMETEGARDLCIEHIWALWTVLSVCVCVCVSVCVCVCYYILMFFMTSL